MVLGRRRVSDRGIQNGLGVGSSCSSGPCRSPSRKPTAVGRFGPGIVLRCRRGRALSRGSAGPRRGCLRLCTWRDPLSLGR